MRRACSRPTAATGGLRTGPTTCATSPLMKTAARSGAAPPPKRLPPARTWRSPCCAAGAGPTSPKPCGATLVAPATPWLCSPQPELPGEKALPRGHTLRRARPGLRAARPGEESALPNARRNGPVLCPLVLKAETAPAVARPPAAAGRPPSFRSVLDALELPFYDGSGGVGRNREFVICLQGK